MRTPTTPEALPVDWDVFVSYPRADAARATALAGALRRQGVRVFVDDSAVESFASITTSISASLARSKILLALYSEAYPQRRACQWELTYAYLAGQREGDPRRRILIVNPEAGTEHIHPLELRDARHASWPASAGAMDELAARVAEACTALDSPLGQPDGGREPTVPWLPAPARAGSARFVGRLPEQWRIHSALRRHHMPLIHRSGHGSARAAQLRGMPGIGKSLLAQEYALRFHTAYPGGVFWFDLHHARRATAVEEFTAQVATVTDALGLGPGPGPGQGQGQGQGPVPGPAGPAASTHSSAPASAPAQLLSRLAVRLGERGAPCLWVVDGLPDGLTDEQLHLLRGPHLLAATLFTTRSLRYTSFAETVDLLPLPDADAYQLLTSRRTPSDPREDASAQALVRDVGGHPHALELLAAHAESSDFDHLRNRLHSPGTDVLADRTSPGHASVAATLLPRPLSGRTPADDVLRLLSLACPAPLSQAALESALASVTPYEPWEVGASLGRALDVLLGAGALRPEAHRLRSWTVHPLLARAVRRHDTDTARQEDLRRTLLHSLTTPEPETEPPGPAAPGPVERAAAFDLHVELVTRVGVQHLDDEAGSLREALSSLHVLFTAARDALHRVAAEATVPVQLTGIAARLLNVELRPFLTRWHTALMRYEAGRPEGTSAVEHEQRWKQNGTMRAELHALRTPLTHAAEELAAMCGVSLLDPPASGPSAQPRP